MKILFSTALFLTLNLSAWAEPSCYSFQPNPQGFTQICIKIEHPENLDSRGVASIYKKGALVYPLNVERIYTPAGVSCAGKEHDCRNFPSSFIIRSPSLNNGNGIALNIHLWGTDSDKCFSGSFEVINRPLYYLELPMVCPKTGW